MINVSESIANKLGDREGEKHNVIFYYTAYNLSNELRFLSEHYRQELQFYIGVVHR